MAQTEFRDVFSVNREQLYSAITQYENYPQFVEGCTSVKVDRQGAGKARVTYHVNVMSQDVTYTLDHIESPEKGLVEWTLVDSNFFKKNNGSWQIQSTGNGKTDVHYVIDVEFKIPVPGFILNKLVKGSLPGMVKSFEKRANSGK
jgi:ribosome-associated toxin RatA of RatAB toxin-antitoxin module